MTRADKLEQLELQTRMRVRVLLKKLWIARRTVPPISESTLAALRLMLDDSVSDQAAIRHYLVLVRRETPRND